MKSSVPKLIFGAKVLVPKFTRAEGRLPDRATCFVEVEAEADHYESTVYPLME